MNKPFTILLLFFLILRVDLHSQNQRFIVKRVTFSSGINDEFSPVYYKDGIVFCSNIRDNSLVSYSNDQNRLFKIVYVPGNDSNGWKQTVLLSKELASGFNDGPATFNATRDTMYYSRNNSIEISYRSMNDTSNKLGIYSAELNNGIWTNVIPFKFNNQLYSLCTPSLSPDGDRIYFSSDMPGGYGKMDLYYCELINSAWGNPVNMGSVINTSKSESFPCAGKYGKLFFASDGHPGLGGKDLYYTQEINGIWINPVHLDSAINSPADDFGLVTDSTFEKGYFSSNRLRTDDIFSFSTTPAGFTSCDTLRENNYCFTLYDDQHHLSDTIPVTYIWDFGNGLKVTGTEVKHCFPGPGKYSVLLNIIDDLTGKAIAENVKYDVELKDAEQVYINSNYTGITGKPLSFDGFRTNLQNFKTTDYLWNFGDGYKPGGAYMTKTFKKEGEYSIRLGLAGSKDSIGIVPLKCVIKKIRILDSYQELEIKGKKETGLFAEKPDSAWKLTDVLRIRLYLMNDLSDRQKSQLKGAVKESDNPILNLNQSGIVQSSSLLLDKISKVLKSDSDMRMNIIVYESDGHLSQMKISKSERWAQEIGFWFRNNGNKTESFVSRPAEQSGSIFKPVAQADKTLDGFVEIMLMKY